MSSFYQLMMRKKEETLYPVITGSLTESPEGVFSGFAYNNYLATQEVLDTSKDFEICIKANTGTMTDNLRAIFRNAFGLNPGNAGFAVGLAGNVDNKRTSTYIIDSSGNQIVNGQTGITYFHNDTDYYFKFSQKINNNNTYTIKLESSTNGINWTIENNWTLSLPIRNSVQGVAFGGGNLNQTKQFWSGSIDLNSSYIKLGSTKYKLQAVVGYTIVGSPTIVDGVVSGFSASDYLTTPILNFSTLDNFEINIKLISVSLTSSTLISYNRFLSIWQGEGNSRIYIDLNDNPSSYRTSFRYTRDDETTITIQRKNSNLYVYGNGELLATYENFTPFDSNREIYWCKSSFNGSLIIKDCYIKNNNKLWFNGQQA